MKNYNILGTSFSLLSYEDVFAAILRWRDSGEQSYTTLTPPYSVLMCRRDSELRGATEGAALTLPDGTGIILAASLLRYPHKGRVTGPTLMLKLCDWGREAGIRHFFYGGAPGVAETLAERIESNFPGLEIAGLYCPPFRRLAQREDRDIIYKINAAEPDIVWVGLGSPKQEKWMAEHLGQIDAAAMIGVGAAFDFHSGRSRWAPKWMRNMGIEWAYRLVHEPKRMWRRNVGSLVFLAGILHQRLQGLNPKNTNLGQTE